MTYISSEIEDGKTYDGKQIDMFSTGVTFETSSYYQTLHQMIPQPIIKLNSCSRLMGRRTQSLKNGGKKEC